MSSGSSNGRSRSALQVVALPGLSGAIVGCGLGIFCALLYVALDPNLRPRFGFFLQRSGPGMVGAFVAVGLTVAGILALLRATKWRRRLGGATAQGLPALGVLLSTIASPAMPWTLNPYTAGAIVTTSDFNFILSVAGVTALAAYPLWRWAVWLVERRWGSAGWLATALGALAVSGLLLTSAEAESSRDAAEGLARISAPDQPKRSVVLVGIDGADWREIDELVERGLLPAFSQLIKQGASGPLATFRPTLSPKIWTTIATGQPPHRHGILDFLEPGSGVPYTSNSWRAPSLWALLGERDVRVGVVGWWVTWPAEEVNGHLISAYSNRSRGLIKGTMHRDLDRQTYPPQLIEEIRPLVVSGAGWGKERLASILGRVPDRNADDRFDDRSRMLSYVLGADRVFTDAAIHLARNYSPSFLAVYMAAPDTAGHAFCTGRNNPWRDRLCGRIIEEVYGDIDQAIGEILTAAPSEATVIVVSDHGFDRVEGHEQGFLHGPPGIIIVKGEGVRPGGSISAASVYDVAPTILALYGLPIPGDFRGRVLLSAFEPDHARNWGFSFGASQTSSLDPDSDALRAIPSPNDQELKERLRALGYIE